MSVGGGGSGEIKNGYPVTHRGSYYKNVKVRFKDVVMGNQKSRCAKEIPNSSIYKITKSKLLISILGRTT